MTYPIGLSFFKRMAVAKTLRLAGVRWGRAVDCPGPASGKGNGRVVAASQFKKALGETLSRNSPMGSLYRLARGSAEFI